MGIDRLVSLISNGSIRRAGRGLKLGMCLTCLAVSLVACAQQSDLVKVEKDLGGKITKLDEEKKALAQVLKQAKQDIADARTALEQQKDELNDEILKARAQIKSELRSLREENLPKAIGDLETQLHQVSQKLEKALQRQGQALNALQERRKQREAELSGQIAALGKRFEKAMEQQGQSVKDQFAAFQDSLGRFKEALAGVNKQLAAEGKRATGAETKIRRDFDKRLQPVDVKLAGLGQTDALHGRKLEEITVSLAQFRDVLGTTGTQLGTKLDSQGKGLEQAGKQVERLQGQYAALAKKLDADLKGLQEYLDRDVRPSLGSIAKAFGEEKSRVSQELAKVKSGLQRVEQASAATATQTRTQVDAQAKHVQALSETLAGMREVLDSMAGTLGTRTDQHMSQLGKMTARLERLEKEQSGNVAQQSSNTQAVSTHLKEVTASVQSIRKSFEQFKNRVSTRMNEQEGWIRTQVDQASKSTAVSADVASLQQGVRANVKQLNDVIQSVAQMKEVARGMGEKLGSKVDAHEAQLHNLEQAVKAVAQMKEVVSGLGEKLGSRVEAHEAQIRNLEQAVKAVAQMKEVVSGLGEKLGSRVEAHEAQIRKLEQAVNMFK